MKVTAEKARRNRILLNNQNIRESKLREADDDEDIEVEADATTEDESKDGTLKDSILGLVQDAIDSGIVTGDDLASLQVSEGDEDSGEEDSTEGEDGDLDESEEGESLEEDDESSEDDSDEDDSDDDEDLDEDEDVSLSEKRRNAILARRKAEARARIRAKRIAEAKAKIRAKRIAEARRRVLANRNRKLNDSRVLTRRSSVLGNRK